MWFWRALLLSVASTACSSPEKVPAEATGGDGGSGQQVTLAGAGAGGAAPSCAVMDARCMACARGCDTEGCSGGKCVLDQLYQPPTEDNVIALALGPDALFWTNSSGEVLRRKLTGGEPASVFDGGGDRTVGMAADSSHVHWAGQMQGKVYAADAQGEAAEVLATLAGQPFDLAIADSATLFVSLGDSGEIWSVARSTGDAAKVATTEAGAVHVAADADYVAWSSVQGGEVGYLVRATGSAATLATGQMRPNSVALRNGVVYWANAGAPEMAVISKRLPDGELVVLASVTGTESVALGSDYIYFAAGAAAYRTPLDGGGTPQPIVTGYQRLGTLATDESWLYFSDFFQGSIGRVAQ